MTEPRFNPGLRLVQEAGRRQFHLTLGETLRRAETMPVTTALLGEAKIPGLPYANPDGSPLKIETDYFGKPRAAAQPTPGPFENPGAGALVLQVR